VEGSAYYSRRVPWPFKRDATKTPFGRRLLSIRDLSEARIADARDIEEPNRIVLLSASAGATVALGAYGAFLIDQFGDLEPSFPGPEGKQHPDHVVQFARSLDSPESIEAAYRVAAWALVSVFAVFSGVPTTKLR
jgi:hypothetical protein